MPVCSVVVDWIRGPSDCGDVWDGGVGVVILVVCVAILNACKTNLTD